MNFDDINKIYAHMSKHIYPNVKTVWNNVSTEEMVIDKYLGMIDDSRLYKLLAMPYLVDAEKFLKKYIERCIIFYNTPDPQDGLMLVVHQISPSLHVHSRFHCWVENNEVHDYMACLLFYKKSDDAVQFLEDNFDLACTGNTEEKSVPSGFGFKGD